MIILLISLIVSPIALSAQQLLPASVQQFMQEREIRQRYASRGVDAVDGFRYVPSHDVNGCEVVDAFVAIDNEMVLPLLKEMGVMVNCIFDGFVTAQVPVKRLEAVSRLQGVRDIEISSRLELCTDSTMAVTHVNQVINGIDNKLPANYDGTGVIVGIIDVGFDYQHRAFRRNDNPSQTRISRVYSTTLKTGHPARNNNYVTMPGSVFMGDEVYRLTTDNSTSSHGTHTASIAAGCHINGYGGMAPGAEIVLCAVSVLDGSMSAVEVTNCLRYIDAYADSVGRPCVISMSVSTPNGPRDGLDYFSKAINQTMGPGRLFVISSGNDGGRIAYAHKRSSPSNPLRVLFKYKSSSTADSSYYYSGMKADLWMRQASYTHYYKFHVLDQWTNKIVWESDRLQSKSIIGIDELGDYFTIDASHDTTGYIYGFTSSSYGKYRLEVTIHNLKNKAYKVVNGVNCGRYALGMSIYPRQQTSVEIDAWACNSGSGLASLKGSVVNIDGGVLENFYATPSDSCCIGTYAVGDSTISAGAFAARNSYYSLPSGSVVTDNSYTIGDIASFSAYQAAGAGPTQRPLPTICAPGVLVVAAGSQYSYFARGSIYTVMKADGSYWGVMSGTSMAAPTVAGIIALWLQANPNLTVADVNDILAQSAIKDSFTMGVHHNQFGANGKIDAYAGMKLVLKRRYMRGDLNGDGIVNILDITLLINYVLGNPAPGIIPLLTDLNGDNIASVADVTALIQIVLNN